MVSRSYGTRRPPTRPCGGIRLRDQRNAELDHGAQLEEQRSAVEKIVAHQNVVEIHVAEQHHYGELQA